MIKQIVTWMLVGWISISVGMCADTGSTEQSLTEALVYETVIRDLGDRTWVVVDGSFGHGLVAQAASDEQTLILLATQTETDEDRDRFEAAVDALGNPRLSALAAWGPLPFAVGWLRIDPDEASKQLAFMTESQYVGMAGFRAISHGTVYQLVKESILESPNWYGAIREGEESRELIRCTIARSKEEGAQQKEGWAGEVRLTQLRQMAARGANDLAYGLYESGRKNEAYEFLVFANALDPANMSALLNRASLVKEGLHPEQKEKIAEELNSKAQTRHGYWNLAQTSGYVIRPQDFFDAQWYWVLSGIPATQEALIRTNLQALAEAKLEESVYRSVLERARLSYVSQIWRITPAFRWMQGVSEDYVFDGEAMLALARVLLDEKMPDRAERLVMRAAKRSDVKPEAVACVRASIQAFRGRYTDAVETLRAVRTEANRLTVDAELASYYSMMGSTSNLLDTVRSIQQAQTNAPLWMRAMIESLEQALESDPEKALPKAYDAAVLAWRLGGDEGYLYRHLLTLDMMVGDKKAALEHARAALRKNPKDAFANYILAISFRDTGKPEEVEHYFQLSLSQNPAWYVWNDYSDFALAKGDPYLAHNLAQMALQNGGQEQAIVWDSYAMALLGMNWVPKALEAIETALQKPGGEDPRIQLHAAEITFSADRIEATQARIQQIRKMDLSCYSKAETERLVRLESQVEQRMKVLQDAATKETQPSEKKD